MNEDKLKKYSPTIMGFAASLLDKLGINFIPAGHDTWHSTASRKDTLTNLNGNPSKDLRTNKERNSDYLNSPYERWKTSMLNNTNPLVGIDRTIGMALAGASTIYGVKSIPTIVKAFARNPKNTLAVSTVGGLIGGEIGKGVSKVDKAIHGQPTFLSTLGNLYGFNVARQIIDPAQRATHFYRTFSPFGYGKDLSGNSLYKRGLNTVKSMLRGYPRNTNEVPEYINSNMKSLSSYNTHGITPEGMVMFRDAAYRKYLGLPERPGHNLYLPNGDGTYSYNIDYVNKIRTGFGGTKFNPSDFESYRTPKGNYGDVITSNGGIVSYNRQALDNGTIKHSIKDDWDLLPFLDDRSGIKWVHNAPKWIKNLEMSGLMGNGKVFTVKQDFYEENK